MKIRYLSFLVLILALSLSIAACKKEEPVQNQTDANTSTQTTATSSTQTTEQTTPPVAQSPSAAETASEQKNPFLSEVYNQVFVSTIATQNEVKATQGLPVQKGQAVRTALDSRAEVTFPDQTVARVGALTTMSFDLEKREWNLSDGSMLFSKPKDGKPMRIVGGSATAAITGTTGFVTCKNGEFSEFGLLEGSAKVTHQSGQTFEIVPGKKLFFDPTGKLKVDSFDVDKMMKESPLLNGFKSKIPGHDALQREADRLRNIGNQLDPRNKVPSVPTRPSLPSRPF